MISPPAPAADPSPFTSRLDELSAEIATHRHGRVPAELRRCHILAVALELFAERGYRDASMDELAARAGVSKPVIYGLVGDKERVFRTCVEAVTDELGERVRTAMRAESEPDACLRAGTRAFFGFAAQVGDGWVRLLANEGGPVSEGLAAARRRQADVVAELLGELLSGLGVDVDPSQLEAMAHAMNGACESLAAWWHLHPERTLDEIVEMAARLVVPGIHDLVDRPLPPWAAGDHDQLTGEDGAP